MNNLNRKYNFVAISGSLRRGSYNTMVLKEVQKLAPENITITQLYIDEVPMYNFDLYGKEQPAVVEKINDAIKDADALIFVTPEYNYSVPGVLKNTIDFISKSTKKPFNLKPVGIISASPGLLGGARAQYNLRQILVAVNAYVLNMPEVMIAQVDKKFDEQQHLTDEKTKEFLSKFLLALADYSSIINDSVKIK